MNEVIKALVELQKIEIALSEVRAQRESGPERIAELEQAYQAAEIEVGTAKHRYDQLTLERSQGELDLKSLEEKLAQYQQQLMEVKTSKEYSAVLKEIDDIKAGISRIESDVLLKLEEMEGLEKDVPEAESKIAEERGRYESTRAELEKELSKVEERINELQTRRDQITGKIPKNILEVFDRITAVRGGIAVVRITEPTCPACNVRLRPQTFTEARRGEKLVTCDTCRRFLYFGEQADPAAEASSNGPPESSDAVSPTGA